MKIVEIEHCGWNSCVRDFGLIALRLRLPSDMNKPLIITRLRWLSRRSVLLVVVRDCVGCRDCGECRDCGVVRALVIASAAGAIARLLARFLASVNGARGTRGTALRLRFVIITTRLPGLSTRSMLLVVARGFAG